MEEIKDVGQSQAELGEVEEEGQSQQ